MQERALANPKVRFAWHSVVTGLVGTDKLGGVMLQDVRTGEERELAATGLFVAIGHVPSSDILRGQLEVDEQGYVLTRDGTTGTSVDGVFAAGDLVDHRYRQAVTAAGTGCMAAIDAERWLEDHEDIAGPNEGSR
jgi:thioredoxin reductase (NADPH)